MKILSMYVCIYVLSPLPHLNVYFYFFARVSRQSTALSSTPQHAKSPEFSGKQESECLNTRFFYLVCYIRDTLLYRVKRKRTERKNKLIYVWLTLALVKKSQHHYNDDHEAYLQPVADETRCSHLWQPSHRHASSVMAIRYGKCTAGWFDALSEIKKKICYLNL